MDAENVADFDGRTRRNSDLGLTQCYRRRGTNQGTGPTEAKGEFCWKDNDVIMLSLSYQSQHRLTACTEGAVPAGMWVSE